MTVDVVVAGGGAAGVAAAVGAARTGARVRLLERHGFLGGTAIAASVLTYCGFFDERHRPVVAGVGRQFLEYLERTGSYRTRITQESGNKVVLLDPETTKAALDDLLLDHGVELALHTTVVGVHGPDERPAAVTTFHAGTHETVGARAFVDCTGDGALLVAAGAPVRVEPPERRQASTLVLRFGGVAPDADLSTAALRQAVTDYRGCHDVELPRDHGSVVRLPVSGEVMVLTVDQHEDVLTVEGRTRAEIAGRRLAAHYLRAVRAIPGWRDCFLAATGPEIGVRETRHLVGREQLTGADAAAGRRRPDEVVARGGWPMEDHAVPGATSYGRIRDGGWYDIPLGSLRSRDRANVWAAGRLVDADPAAFSSVRVMGTAFATGHAAGVAAALQAAGEPDDRRVVQEVLRAQGALL
ncbi:FAD-dependent oxidoreductase [Pseudonocardia zijingensis]|uniref:FAD-dependent oxidoreductase n=1 Tax=Pseudonocardia zijingensis TaxID=153376 RepID=A0ABP3YMN7_9PSEU